MTFFVIILAQKLEGVAKGGTRGWTGVEMATLLFSVLINS